MKQGDGSSFHPEYAEIFSVYSGWNEEPSPCSVSLYLLYFL